MQGYRPRKKMYLGPVILDSQPRNWLKRKRSFASKEWFESQVRYGQWLKEPNKPGLYLIYAEVVERREPIRILIKIRHEQDHVLVYHAHVI